MKNLTVSSKTILIYRVIFTALSWFTIFTGMIISVITNVSILPWFNSFKYFTMQTNLIVTIWLTLAIVWHNKPEFLEKITGPLKGAFTLYITITFIFFAIILSPFYHPPTPFAAFSNLVLHYITPIAFILDWILTETKMRYKWNYLHYWIVYPIGYLVFALIHGKITGDYLYFILDISAFELLTVPIVFFLVTSGIALGCLYIAISRKRTQSQNS